MYLFYGVKQTGILEWTTDNRDYESSRRARKVFRKGRGDYFGKRRELSFQDAD